jgi:hypothetical protein
MKFRVLSVVDISWSEFWGSHGGDISSEGTVGGDAV